MIVAVRKMGTPSLLEPSLAVQEGEFNSPELFELIENLGDTQQHLGGVGIAAPQIGVNKRVVLIEYYQSQVNRYSEIGDCPRKVIINPELTLLDGEQTWFNEGCLSLPGLRGQVQRPKALRYRYYDESGQVHQGEDDGFFARVLQHECDHLDGILYPMRMQDISLLAYTDIEIDNAALLPDNTDAAAGAADTPATGAN